MVGGPIAAVEDVRFIEAGCHALDARRPVEQQRRVTVATNPTHQRDVAEAVDVVGVEMGKQHSRVAANAQTAKRAAGGFAGIDDEQALASDHGGAGRPPIAVRKGSARSAHYDVQAVGQAANQVGGHAFDDPTLHHFQGQRAPRGVQAAADEQRQDDQSRQNAFHAPSPVSDLIAEIILALFVSLVAAGVKPARHAQEDAR